MNRAQYCLFDLDGTLTDPAPGIVACLVFAAHAMGHSSVIAAKMERFIGPPLRDSFREILNTQDDDAVERAVGLYRERFCTLGLFENSVYPGIRRCLAALSAEGVQLRVVTSKPSVYANRIIDHFELRGLLPIVYGAELSGERSDKAELLAHTLAAERIDPAQACMVGDREYDIAGARAHGIASIGVSWGYGAPGELEAALADRVVSDVRALADTAISLLASATNPR